MQNPVGWFEIYVDDMERAKAFYEKVLAVQLVRLPSPELEMWAFPMSRETYGASGTLAKKEGCKAGGNSVLVYFHSPDCGIELARVTAAGGSIIREKTSIGPYGYIALAGDTEGNLFGLHSME